jgi:hypothetical protein
MRQLQVLIVALLVAGCSSLNLDTVNRLRTLDYLHDDIASLVLAFDLPRGVEPRADGSVLTFDVTTASAGERHLKAVLQRADVDEVAGMLPAPARERVYFLFGFSDKDKAALRSSQEWARALPSGSGGSIKVSLSPAFCAIAPVDPLTTNISVLIALPGETSLAPLISNQKLGEALKGAPLEAC